MPSGSRALLACGAAVAFAALVVALPAGRLPILGSNEARYMLLARDIVEEGRWLVPDLRGQPYLNKPQLYFWSVAAASLPGGAVTEWTAALPAVLSSIATAAAVCAIGTSVWGWRVGAMATLALASTLGFFAIGHEGQSDVMVAAWTWWSLFFLLRARATGWRLTPLLGFYACVAAAIMSKGPAGLIGLVGGIVAVAMTDGWRAIGRLRLGVGLLVLAVLLSPWYGTYLSGYRSEFVSDIVVGEYGSWLFRRGLLTRLESLWVLAYALPWTPFLAAAVPWWRRAPDSGRRLVGVWTLALWAMVGLSGIHRARYLFPIYPGLALMAGEFIVRAGARGGARPLRAGTRAFFVLAAVASAVALSPLARRIGGEGRPYVPDSPAETVLLTAVLLLGAVAAVVAAERQAFYAAGLAVGLAVGAILLAEGARYPARFARDFDVRPLAAAAREVTPLGAAVAGYPDLPLAYDFYLHGPVVELNRAGVERLLAGPPLGALILPDKSWAALRPAASPGWRVVASRRVADRRMLVLGGGGS
jgi:4-amino-4-deoxy-L-arabinose transferase-like glycosyltransferase